LKISRDPLPAFDFQKGSAHKVAMVTGESFNIYDIPCKREDAAVVLVPVPWEATVSYGQGAAEGPEAIRIASAQLDVFDLDFGRPDQAGIIMESADPEIQVWSAAAREKAAALIAQGEFPDLASSESLLLEVNTLSERLNQNVYEKARLILGQKKIPGIVGGDHSSPLGALRAYAESNRSFGILHIDAHHDLRKSYQGFRYSHASIMRNVCEELSGVSRIVQLGIRDFCEEEAEYAKNSKGRIVPLYDETLWSRKLNGESWSAITDSVLALLPENVWISFDIDGLDPRFCPGTGTPVPGGIEFREITFMLSKLANSGKTIGGFDLCEVSPSEGDCEWNGNVGMRLIYKLCGAALKSQGRLP